MNPEIALVAFSASGAIGTWLIRILWALEVAAAFGLLVTVHEFGHFIFGKLTRMKVEEFSIGFGKRILGWKKGETEYSIRIVPLGGYCKIYGMEEGEEEQKTTSSEDIERAFNNRPLWERFLVIIAGSAMNAILAIVLIAASGMIIGFNYSLIDDVVKGGPADRAGIKPGDKIRMFAYQSEPSDIGDAIRSRKPSQGLQLKVVDGNVSRTVVVHPEIETDENGVNVKRIGVLFNENSNYSEKIDRIMYDSPYQKAGLVPGDVITEINGQPVRGFLSTYQMLLETPGDSIEIKVKRGDSEFKFTLSDYKIRRSGLVAETVQTENGYELVIRNVIFDTPAMHAMLKPGMRIVEVDGKPITSDFVWSEYEMNPGPLWIPMKVIDPKENGEPITLELQRVMLHPGIGYKTDWIRVPPHVAFIEASSQAKVFGRLIFDVLGGLFTSKTEIADLSGPVGIISFTYKAASWGLVNLIIIVSLISVNLGIVNLLPFPGLDGGRAVFLIVELIARKPVINARIENIIHLVGFFVLIAFILFITYFDFSRIFGIGQ